MKLRLTNQQRAFSLIEVAIALGVIAVALVAIIGVLPAGLQVQRDNRQDTIINQDAAYLIEAIRGSAENIPDLAEFAEVVDGAQVGGITTSEIIARMSEPIGTHSNVFRSISGSAALRGPGVPTFRYMVFSEVRRVPSAAVNPDLTYNGLSYTNELAAHLYEVRLSFLWPMNANGTALPDVFQKQVVRTVIAGKWDPIARVFNLSEFQP
jgi:prepilin-type N-terminal cleavage/methylation domain-containing protein